MKSKFLYPILMTLCITSCIEEIEFNNEQNSLKLNISGQFTNDSLEQAVEIRKVSNFKEKEANISEPIVDAEVYILENNATRIPFRYKENGKYTSNQAGKIDNTYQLIVKYKEDIYKSSIQKMQKNAKIASANLVPVVDTVLLSSGNIGTKNMLTVRIKTTLNDGVQPLNVFYKFYGMYEFVDRPFIGFSKSCYIEHRSDAGKITTLSGENFANNQLDNYKIFSFAHDYKFYYKYLLGIEQYSIDTDAYEYWSKVQELVKPTRSIFDPPPGVITGNITGNNLMNQSEGYFTVASKEILYLNTNSSKLGFVAEDYCGLNGVDFFSRYRECSDCLLFANSSVTRPSFWPQ